MKRIDLLASESDCSKQEIAEKYFASQGCQLIDSYSGATAKMAFICKCGRQGKVSWNTFTTRNRRCGYCSNYGRKIGYTLEEAKQFFADKGCDLLADEYKDATIPMPYICPLCKQVKYMCLSALLYQGQSNCKKCTDEKRKGAGSPCWISDRAMLKEKISFRKRCYKMLRRCLLATGKPKLTKTEEMLGYTIQELHDHITLHPNWERVKNQKWHLDHIFPIEAFLEHGITDFKIINSLDNLQPLTHSENDSKGSKYDSASLLEWLKKYSNIESIN